MNSATHYTLLRAELQHPRMLGSPSFWMNRSLVRRGGSWVERGGDPCGTTLVSVVSVGTLVSDVSVVSIVSEVSVVSVVSVGTLVSIVSVLKKNYPCKPLWPPTVGVTAPGTHKGPSTPNLTPCHYISGERPATRRRRDGRESGAGSSVKCSSTGWRGRAVGPLCGKRVWGTLSQASWWAARYLSPRQGSTRARRAITRVPPLRITC